MSFIVSRETILGSKDERMHTTENVSRETF